MRVQQHVIDFAKIPSLNIIKMHSHQVLCSSRELRSSWSTTSHAINHIKYISYDITTITHKVCEPFFRVIFPNNS